MNKHINVHGVTSFELEEAKENIIKMNAEQVQAFWLWFQNHIKSRAKRGLL